MNPSPFLRALRDPVLWGLLLPPLVFLGWTVFGPLTLGNDYLFYNVSVPLTLRFYTGEGLEPMWYPHQTGGIPVGGLAYAQYFHLPAWLGSRTAAFWEGDALRVLATRHLVLFAVLHVAYYVVLRRAVRVGRAASWLVSLVLVYSLRSLDAFRYGIALDAAAYGQGMLLLSTLHLVRPSRWVLLLILVCSQLLFTCGYPVLVPLFLLVALLSLPALVPAVGVARLVRRGSEAVAAATAGFLLAAPHWIALSEWIAVNDTRVARPSLAWAGEWAMPPVDILTNLFFPWRAEVHSSFGGSTLFAALVVAVVLALVRERGWPLLAALAFPLVYALGRVAPLFPFFFGWVPGFGNLRGPGRAVYMLAPLLVAAGLWLRTRDERLTALYASLRLAALVTAAGCWLGLLALATGHAGGDPPEYSPAALTGWWTPPAQATWLTLGFVAALALHRVAAAPLPWMAAVLIVATAGQVGMTMRYGTWIAERKPSPGRSAFLSADHLPLYAGPPLLATNELRRKSEGSATVAYAGFVRNGRERTNCFLPVQADRERGVLLPFYLSDRLECVESRDAALAALQADGDCLATGRLRTIVVDGACGSTSREAPLADLGALNERNRVVALTTNVLALEVEPPRDAVLVTPFPEATSNWEGTLDGRPATLLSVNGGFWGLRVPAGRHRVGVRYFSEHMVLGYRLAAGVAIVLLAGAGLVLLVPRARGGLARAVASTALFVGLVTVVLAYRAWERGFVERARREIVLNHDYPVLLREQLERWRTAGLR